MRRLRSVRGCGGRWRRNGGAVVWVGVGMLLLRSVCAFNSQGAMTSQERRLRVCVVRGVATTCARRGARALEAECASAEERLASAVAREERARAEVEAVRRELGDKLWDVEQRVR